MAAYQVLARKWRPKTFADLVGQQHVVKALQNALDKGRLHHAYLLTGTRGVGKTTIARILAKSLNCENPTHGEPCGVCQSCQDIDAGRFVDLLEIDAASNTGIDNIREVLENAQYAPTAGKYKVYIIDEVHMLSKSAFNAMLKTLEEPPEHVKFILATTDPHKVPITVLSRCLQFVLRNMTPQQVAEHLAHVLKTEQIVYEPTALALLGRAAQGSMRDALSLLDQAIAMGSGSVKETDIRHMIGAVDKRYLFDILHYLMEQNGEALLNKAKEMAANAIGFDSALNDLAMLLQKLALLKTVPSALDNDDPEYERLQLLAQYFSDEQLQLYYQCVIHGKQDLPLAPDEYAGFIMTLLRMLAFAPFAAQNVPESSSIEGTQLHNNADAHTKKPTLPETTNISNKTTFRQPNEYSDTHHIQESHLPTATSDELNHQAMTATWEESKTPVKQPEIERYENADTHIMAAPNDFIDNPLVPQPDNIPVPPTETEASQSTEIVEQDETDSASSLNTATPIDAVQPQIDKNEDVNHSITPIDNEPMPNFQAENWPMITQRISHQISAARMGLDNMAWVSFENGVLTLAVAQEQTKNTLNKTYFDRISTALSEAYHQNIQIRTQPFSAEHGWETPAMYRHRLVEENREQAKSLMEQDNAVKDLIQLFDAKWKEESIKLHTSI